MKIVGHALRKYQHVVPDPTNKRSDINFFLSFLEASKEYRLVKYIPGKELNQKLCRFFFDVHRADGSKYPLEIFDRIMANIDLYLNEIQYGFSIQNSPEFFEVRTILRTPVILGAAVNLFRSEVKINESESMSIYEIDLLWEQEQLGIHTPNSIINTLWLYNSICFGLYWAPQHRLLKWGDVELRHDSMGLEYLEYVISNPNELFERKQIYPNLKIQDRCPIAVYKMYANKRPADYCSPLHPFYLETYGVFNPHRSVDWFKEKPMEVNDFSNILEQFDMEALN